MHARIERNRGQESLEIEIEGRGTEAAELFQEVWGRVWFAAPLRVTSRMILWRGERWNLSGIAEIDSTPSAFSSSRRAPLSEHMRHVSCRRAIRVARRESELDPIVGEPTC